jgi:predicted SnoaL-like aldol condensation-catalyzing enzyme
MRDLANADYIQHNPFIPTGLKPFIQMLPVRQENGITAENIRMFQDGDYVFMHNIWIFLNYRPTVTYRRSQP